MYCDLFRLVAHSGEQSETKWNDGNPDLRAVLQSADMRIVPPDCDSLFGCPLLGICGSDVLPAAEM
jgi:hypothetical protein